ncbi:hypothetical protein PMAYCL1PPCAC_01620, partial [Pristionchus mayeri]
PLETYISSRRGSTHALSIELVDNMSMEERARQLRAERLDLICDTSQKASLVGSPLGNIVKNMLELCGSVIRYGVRDVDKVKDALDYCQRSRGWAEERHAKNGAPESVMYAYRVAECFEQTMASIVDELEGRGVPPSQPQTPNHIPSTPQPPAQRPLRQSQQPAVQQPQQKNSLQQPALLHARPATASPAPCIGTLGSTPYPRGRRPEGPQHAAQILRGKAMSRRAAHLVNSATTPTFVEREIKAEPEDEEFFNNNLQSPPASAGQAAPATPETSAAAAYEPSDASSREEEALNSPLQPPLAGAIHEALETLAIPAAAVEFFDDSTPHPVAPSDNGESYASHLLVSAAHATTVVSQAFPSPSTVTICAATSTTSPDDEANAAPSSSSTTQPIGNRAALEAHLHCSPLVQALAASGDHSARTVIEAAVSELAGPAPQPLPSFGQPLQLMNYATSACAISRSARTSVPQFVIQLPPTLAAPAVAAGYTEYATDDMQSDQLLFNDDQPCSSQFQPVGSGNFATEADLAAFARQFPPEQHNIQPVYEYSAFENEIPSATPMLDHAAPVATVSLTDPETGVINEQALEKQPSRVRTPAVRTARASSLPPEVPLFSPSESSSATQIEDRPAPRARSVRFVNHSDLLESAIPSEHSADIPKLSVIRPSASVIIFDPEEPVIRNSEHSAETSDSVRSTRRKSIMKPFNTAALNNSPVDSTMTEEQIHELTLRNSTINDSLMDQYAMEREGREGNAPRGFTEEQMKERELNDHSVTNIREHPSIPPIEGDREKDLPSSENICDGKVTPDTSTDEKDTDTLYEVHFERVIEEPISIVDGIFTDEEIIETTKMLAEVGKTRAKNQENKAPQNAGVQTSIDEGEPSKQGNIAVAQSATAPAAIADNRDDASGTRNAMEEQRTSSPIKPLINANEFTFTRPFQFKVKEEPMDDEPMDDESCSSMENKKLLTRKRRRSSIDSIDKESSCPSDAQIKSPRKGSKKSRRVTGDELVMQEINTAIKEFDLYYPGKAYILKMEQKNRQKPTHLEEINMGDKETKKTWINRAATMTKNGQDFEIDYIVGSTDPGMKWTSLKLECKLLIVYKGFPRAEWVDYAAATNEYNRAISEFVQTQMAFDQMEAVVREECERQGVPYDKVYPSRYLTSPGKGNRFGMSRLAVLRTKLLALQHDLNEINKVDGAPPLYIADWTGKKYEFEDSSIGSFSFTNYPQLSRRVEKALEKGNIDGINQRCAFLCDCDRPTSKWKCKCNEKNSDHSSRIECGDSCPCEVEKCSTRTVQRGRQVPLIVFNHHSKGWTNRIFTDMNEGDFVHEYVAKLYSHNENRRMSQTYAHEQSSSIVDTSMKGTNARKQGEGSVDYGYTHRHLVLNGLEVANEARFNSHACRPVMKRVVTYIGRRSSGLHRTAFFAAKDLRCGEELTWNYEGHALDGALAEGKPFTSAKLDACECDEPNCPIRKNKKPFVVNLEPDNDYDSFADSEDEEQRSKEGKKKKEGKQKREEKRDSTKSPKTPEKRT